MFLKILIALALTASLYSCENSEDQVVATKHNLVLEDHFDGDKLNADLWSYNIGTGVNGWGNNELQYYTDRAENIKVEDGMLKITALKETYEGSAYTSAKIVSKAKFEQQYGRFEARIKLPWGQGLWPAFWLLGSNIDEVSWPNCGEIDIMEYRGQEPTFVHGSVHGPGYSGANAVSKSYELSNDRFDTDFHVFGIEWDKDYINFYVDDALYKQITPDELTGDWVFDQAFYMLINLAVGGNFIGPPNENTVFPQTMYVDYVRVYK